MSARPGRYKKHLASKDEVKIEGELVYQRLCPLFTKFENKEITDIELTAAYVMSFQSFRKPNMWLGGKNGLVSNTGELQTTAISILPEDSIGLSPNIQKRIGRDIGILELVSGYSLKGIPLRVNRLLLAWYSQKLPLDVIFEVPSSIEILEMQARGRRCVTLIRDRDLLGTYILQQRDPLSFCLHDLMHAERFFMCADLFDGQVGFYNLALKAWRSGIFDNFLTSDPEFKKEFEYVVSDMNSFSVHMLKCLKAVCIGAFLRGEGKAINDQLSATGSGYAKEFFAKLFDLFNLHGESLNVALNLNTDREDPKEFGLLDRHFTCHRQPRPIDKVPSDLIS